MGLLNLVSAAARKLFMSVPRREYRGHAPPPAAEMRPAERGAPRIPGVGKAPVVLMSAAVLPMSIDCVKLRLRSCCNTVLCPGAEFLQIHRFDGATPGFAERRRCHVHGTAKTPRRPSSTFSRTSMRMGLSVRTSQHVSRGSCSCSQVDAFRFLVMLQKSSLIDRVLGFAGGHICSSRFRFFLCPPLTPAGSYA